MNHRYVQVRIAYRDRVGRSCVQTEEVRLPIDATSVNPTAEVRLKPRDRVQVRFHGNSTPYSYLMHPDECARVEIGDQVAVMSPLTNRVEYPEIVSFDQRASASKWARAMPDVLEDVRGAAGCRRVDLFDFPPDPR